MDSFVRVHRLINFVFPALGERRARFPAIASASSALNYPESRFLLFQSDSCVINREIDPLHAPSPFLGGCGTLQPAIVATGKAICGNFVEKWLVSEREKAEGELEQGTLRDYSKCFVKGMQEVATLMNRSNQSR